MGFTTYNVCLYRESNDYQPLVVNHLIEFKNQETGAWYRVGYHVPNIIAA